MAKKKSGPWSMAGLSGKFKKLFKKRERYDWYVPPGQIKDGNVGAAIKSAQENRNNSLDLSGATELTGRGLAKLKEMKGLKGVKLKDAKLTDADLEALKGLETLEWLDLSGVHTNGACFTKLGKLPALEYLNLSKTAFCDAAVPALKQHTALGVLDLSETQVTDQGVGVLAEMTSLRLVRLKGAPVDVAILATIARSEVEWDL
jgi:uncharacterized protein YjbI with pentapeptide repeats